MFLEKFRKNQLTKERLKDIKAGVRSDCEPPSFVIGCEAGYYFCEFSILGAACIPQGSECII